MNSKKMPQNRRIMDTLMRHKISKALILRRKLEKAIERYDDDPLYNIVHILMRIIKEHYKEYYRNI